ncbi:B3/4 domain-containing protein [Chakrabartyella piscis]|uniref:B3/B4 domain-containing protein n=1 Tax=Chakrabartyella piscis TaxID=2918914 RepID=UPI00295839E1|nr:phenylalanine--tRNA ligase beta subunit-related protein [Chakrabartyella piscis]
MISVQIGYELKTRCPQAHLALVQCKVSVCKTEGDLLQIFNEKIAELAEVELSQANKRETIQNTRVAYKALGKDPNRYRNSSEAMCRRIAKDRGLYYVNNVVDINNLLSISTGYSMGTYDVSQISGGITWERAEDGTEYQGIGKDVLNISFLPALFDDLGPFGNPTSDNTRAMIGDATKEILLMYYLFDDVVDTDILLANAKSVLESYANATDVEIAVCME